jgi:hypothetical protein
MEKALSAPVALWAFAILSIGDTVVRSFRGSMHLAPSIFAIVVIVLWNVGLLSGARLLWIATVGLLAFFLVLGLATEGIAWLGDLATLFVLCLLMLPSTRRFFRSNDPLSAP